jgi:hypothetical protein
VRWHVRQLPNGSWLGDEAFFTFHDQKRRQILTAARGASDVTTAMAFVRALLFRRHLGRLGRRGGTAPDEH